MDSVRVLALVCYKLESVLRHYVVTRQCEQCRRSCLSLCLPLADVLEQSRDDEGGVRSHQTKFEILTFERFLHKFRSD